MVAATLSQVAYERIRRLILTLALPPGVVVNDNELQDRLGIGRTPIREALQRLAREQFITVIPRRGMFVAGLDEHELPMLYETRSVMEPYAARLAALRGTAGQWQEMEDVLAGSSSDDIDSASLLDIDRQCHEIMWAAAGNRFLTDTLDALYAQSERLWHMYLAGVGDMHPAIDEHVLLLGALRCGDGDTAAKMIEAHVNEFDTLIRGAAVRRCY